MKLARLGEAGFGLVVILLGVFVAVETANIPVGPAYSRIGPRLFPWLIAGALCITGAVLLANSLRGRDMVSVPRVDWLAIVFVGLGLLAQILLMTTLGFIVASTVLFVAVTWAFGSRQFVRNTVIGLLLCAATQIVFTWGLGLRLPAGVFAGLM